MHVKVTVLFVDCSHSYTQIVKLPKPKYFLEWSVCSCLTQFILFDGRGLFTLLPKVQLHVSALDNSHLQVVHESLESSYKDLMWAVYSRDVGWGVKWARDLVRVMEVRGWVYGVTVLMYI